MPSPIYTNIFIQLISLLTFQYYGFMWALYPIIILLSLMIFLNTIGVATFLSTKVDFDENLLEKSRSNEIITFISYMLYVISIVHLYLVGFVFFSGIASAHIIINILGLISVAILHEKGTQDDE